tara:strand:+ start:1945 stop:2199 length:255 start_codon:yes stop_codon:yes gene_type:complete
MSNPSDINKQFEQITKHLDMNIEVFELSETDPLIDELQEQFAQEMLNSVVMIPFTFIAELPDIVFEEVINILKELHYGTDDNII